MFCHASATFCWHQKLAENMSRVLKPLLTSTAWLLR